MNRYMTGGSDGTCSDESSYCDHVSADLLHDRRVGDLAGAIRSRYVDGDEINFLIEERGNRYEQRNRKSV